MKAWQGVLGLLDTPTADGRFLWQAEQFDHRELPRPLFVGGPMFDAQVGVIAHMSFEGGNVTGSGDLDLRLLHLLNTPMAEALADGHPVGVGLNIETSSMRARKQGYADALVDDPFAWSIKGAHLTDHPAWTEARITLLT